MLKRLIQKIESIFKYRYLANNEKGAYNFLLQKLYKSTDIDFLENVWQLDFFREVLVPQELDISEMKNVLVLAPHQDDEAIGCGGLLLKLSQQKTNVHLCFLTDGAELSNADDSPRTRAEEAAKVAQKLNAEISSLEINNITLEIQNEDLDTLVQLINKGWDTIVTVWPLDQPAKHRLCSYLVGEAVRRSTFKKDLLFYAVHTDLLPNYYLDITQSIDQKQALINTYTSQINAQRYDHISRGLDAWRSRFLKVSNEERFVEVFMKIGHAGYVDFQEIYRKVDAKKLLKGNDAAIQSFQRLKQLK